MSAASEHFASVRRDFAARLRARAPLCGLIVKMPSPALLEIAGHCGFDFAVIDTEHGPGDAAMLEDHLRAADSAGLPALVRVAVPDSSSVLHALDAGAAGIVAPHVAGPDAAEAIVRAVRYPPRGARGLATSTRAGFYGATGIAAHLRLAEEGTIVLAQLEHRDAVEHAAAIARTDGIDGVFIGPSDLSISLGHPGETDHPVVRDAIERASAAVLDVGGAALCLLADGERSAANARADGGSVVLFAAPQLIAQRFNALVSGARSDGGSVVTRRQSPNGGVR